MDTSEMHQDTTSVCFHGQYADQPAQEQADRPPRITFGYSKDHRPDLESQACALSWLEMLGYQRLWAKPKFGELTWSHSTEWPNSCRTTPRSAAIPMLCPFCA